jgi:hypothetical protein
MSNVQDAIQAAAGRFASEVVALLRGATLQDILSLTGKAAPVSAPSGSLLVETRRGRGGHGAGEKPKARRARSAGRKRSREEVQKLAERVVEYLRTVKDEVGVSGIAEALKVNTADLGLPLSKLRAESKIKTRGQKRSTVYRLA